MKNVNRRDFIKLTGSSLIGLTFGGTALRAYAADERLDPADPAAKALQYVHQSAVDGALCANCQFIAEPAGEWRKCMLFGDKKVNENGWCAAYNKKA